MNTKILRAVILRVIGICGFVIFAAAFFFTYSIPDAVERFAGEFIESEVLKKIDTTIDGLKPTDGASKLSKIATSIYKLNEEKISQLKGKLKSRVHEEMAGALAKIRNLDCECREKWKKHFEQGLKLEISLLQAANDKLVDFIHASYVEVMSDLKQDIRTFTGINAAIFLFVLLISFTKPVAITHLFVPAILLVVSTTICSYLYIFEQNWLLTIIYSKYWGFAYLSYLSIVFLFLCDIVFNQARVTTEVLNSILHAIGSAVTVVPC